MDHHERHETEHRLTAAPLSRRAIIGTALVGVGALAGGRAIDPLGALAETPRSKRTIKVGGKDFTEDILIAHMYALLLQQAGIPVSEHPNLATSIAHSSLLRGDIDLYPEYTGTGVENFLKLTNVAHNAKAYYQAVSSGYQKRFHATWLEPAPLNDTQGLATTRQISQKYGIKTISDMVKQAAKLRFIANSEFLSRPDGLPGLVKTYGKFAFKSTVQIAGAGSVRYAALVRGQGDIVVAFTTDGPIAADHLVVLVDDKHYAPPDQVAPVVRDDALKAYPQIKTVLNKLAPVLTSSAIQKLNYQIDGQHMDMDAVARSFLQAHGLLKT